LLEQHGLSPKRLIETPSAASVCAMVASGLGLAVVNPLTALDYLGRGVVIRRLNVSIAFRVSIVRPMQRSGNALVDALETALHAQARQRLRDLNMALS
jgi:DNA-binding transcriptional LysR family regulator